MYSTDINPHYAARTFRVDVYFNTENGLGAVRGAYCGRVLKETLEGIVDELRDCKPWAIVQVLKDRKYRDIRTDVYAERSVLPIS